MRVAGLSSSSSELGASATADLSLGYVSRNLATVAGLYPAAGDGDGGFTASGLDLELSSALDDDVDPVLSPDGLNITFSSNRPLLPLGVYNLWTASRSSTAMPFDPPVQLGGASSSADERSPAPALMGDLLCFIRGTDVICSTRVGLNTYTTGTKDNALSVGNSLMGLSLSPDGLVAYFGADDAGTLDVYRASRASTDAGFNGPSAVVELNTAFNEYPTWVSPDDCVMLLLSDRPGSAGVGYDVWLSKRPP